MFDFLVEEIKNKNLFNRMYEKWKIQKPDLNPQLAEFLFEKFTSLESNRFVITNPNIKTFLNRFDGSIGEYPKFDATKVREIQYYNYDQILFLVGEFFDLPQGLDDVNTNIIAGKDEEPNPKIIDASKNLWYSKNDFLIVDEDGFRVYQIPNRQASINFGYYEGFMSESEPYKSSGRSHMQWCTTRHVVNRNLWSGYRDRRTFYFVIDESKNPDVEQNLDVNQYYLSALQYSTDSGVSKFRITSILNNGSDPIFNEDGVYNVYPKLRGQLDKIVPVKYDPVAESGEDTDVVNMINEQPGYRYQFSIMSKRHKKAYIDRHKTITKGESWLSMDEDLKKTYIDFTEKTTVFERFSTFDLINTISKKDSEINSLNRRLKILGLSIGTIIDELMKNNYRVRRTSTDNPDIRVYESKSDGLCGIYHSKKGWLDKDGVSYEPTYKEIGSDIFTDIDGIDHFVEIFKSTNGNDKFYCLYSTVHKQNEAHIASQQMWEKLLSDNEVDPETENPDVGGTKIDPEKHVDIKEFKKGL